MQTAPSIGRSILKTIERTVLSRRLDESGPHVDPLRTPAPARRLWEREHRMPWASREMAAFRACMSAGDLGVRDAVLSELAEYHGLSEAKCRDLCVDWEKRSLEEWRAADRSTPEGIIEFYDEAKSWVFDLMWYGYLQTEGFGLASSAIAARFATRRLGGGDHLDFGSGVGLTSQLFDRLGFRTTSADISKPMLDFAAWRMARHGGRCRFVNLRTERLPSAAYDLITAIDTLVHVPDFDVVVRDLRRALRPGGYLITNFDVRVGQNEASAWHLYDSDIDLDLRLRAAGFSREPSLSPVTLCYRRAEPDAFLFKLENALARSAAPARRCGSVLRRVRWPTSARLRKLFPSRLEISRTEKGH